MSRKNKRREIQPMLKQKIKIQTSLGEAELTPDATVQVYINRKNSILKEVRDLNKGDRVLFKIDRISAKFKDVVPLLESNPFYRHVRSQVFYRYNSEQDKVTMLRKLLLEGLMQRGYLSDADEIKRKIVMEGTNLSYDEFQAARRGLEEILRNNPENKEIPRSESTFRNWIGNESVLTWSVYLPLLAQINPQLSEFSDKKGDRYHAYQFWKTVRQQVMNKLHRGNGGRKSESREYEKPDYHIVVDDIVNQIVEEYDEKTAIAQVVSKIQTTPNRNLDSESAVVLRGKEEPISLEQLLYDHEIIKSYFNSILKTYFSKADVSGEKLIELGRLFGFLLYHGEEEELKKIAVNENQRKGLDYWIDSFTKNKIDQHFGLPDGTIRRLASLRCSLESHYPKEIDKSISMTEELLNAKDIREFEVIEGQVNRLAKKLKEKYGFSLIDAPRKVTASSILKKRDINLPKDFTVEDFRKVREQLSAIEKEKKYKIFRISEIRETLKRYGFERVIHMSPIDLIFDVDAYRTKTFPAITQMIFLGNAQTLGSKTPEKPKKSYSHLKPRATNPEWIKKVGEGHVSLVNRLIGNPDEIETGLELIGYDYSFNQGWARADLLGIDAKGNPLVIEIKQNATRSEILPYKIKTKTIIRKVLDYLGGKLTEKDTLNFNNAMKAVEQTAGYRAATQAFLNYCPLTRALNIPVRGMLVAYNIDEDAKKSLEACGCEYKEVNKKVEENKEIK